MPLLWTEALCELSLRPYDSIYCQPSDDNRREAQGGHDKYDELGLARPVMQVNLLEHLERLVVSPEGYVVAPSNQAGHQIKRAVDLCHVFGEVFIINCCKFLRFKVVCTQILKEGFNVQASLVLKDHVIFEEKHERVGLNLKLFADLMVEIAVGARDGVLLVCNGAQLDPIFRVLPDVLVVTGREKHK